MSGHRRNGTLLNGLCQSKFLCELLKRIPSLEFLQLDRRVLVQELINAHIAAANSDAQLALRYPDFDAFRAKFIDTCGLSEEHDFESVPIREVVDEIGELLVHGILLDWNVDGNL